MKLADLIKANHNIMLLLPRFGIPLGFGEKSVQDVCAAHNVPVDFMLLICNVYTFDDYLPDIEQLAATNMQPLVPYLKESHRYYTGERLPHIEAHLHHIADRVEGKYGQILKQFYADFRREIEDHFKYEEQYDFPVLLSLQNGERRKRSQMSHSQRSHSGLVDKMNDLPQIVYKYRPGNVLPEETIEGEFFFGAFCSTRSLGGMVKLPMAENGLHDGKHELLMVRRPRSITDLSGILPSMLAGSYDHPLVVYRHVEEAVFHMPEPMPWSLDGERGDAGTRVAVRNLPSAYRLMMPGNKER